MPQVMMSPVVENTLPSINNVQESIKSFANEVNAQQEVQTEVLNSYETEMQISDLSTDVSPVAASATTARDMLLAKAKAFRETQISQVVTQDKGAHPEQLSMMDEEKHFEEARKMARDILEVPAFIRKKQGADLQN
jgi:cell division protein FtsZ